MGEDFTSDPVTRTLGICIRIFSGGQLLVDLQSFSQVAYKPLYFACLNLEAKILKGSQERGQKLLILQRVFRQIAMLDQKSKYASSEKRLLPAVPDTGLCGRHQHQLHKRLSEEYEQGVHMINLSLAPASSSSSDLSQLL